MNHYLVPSRLKVLSGTICLWIFLTGIALAQTGIDSGMVAHWPLCANGLDISGNNHHGTTNSVVATTDRFGVANAAYQFNGSNSSIEVPYHNNFNFPPSGQFSISLWAQPFNNNTFGAILVKSLFNPNVFASLWDYGIYQIPGQFMTGYANQNFLLSPLIINPGINPWFNVAVTYNNKIWKLYIDGQLVNYDSTGTKEIRQSLGGLAIGKKGFANGDFFSGKIDDVRVYNRQLTDQEVLLLYNLNNIQAPNQSSCGPAAITLTATNGSSYRWYTTPTGGTPVSTSASFTTPVLTATTTYYVTTLNECGQELPRKPVVVTINPFPSVIQNSFSLCQGDSVLPILQNVNSVTWSPVVEISCTNCLNPVIKPTSSRYYFFTAVSGAGCLVIDSIFIQLRPKPPIFPTPPNTAGNLIVVCANDSIILGGNYPPGLFFEWSPPNGLSNPFIANPKFSTLQAGAKNLTLRVTNSDSCSSFDSVFVTVMGLPTLLNSLTDKTLCTGDSVVIGPTSASSTFVFDWLPPDGLSNPNIFNPKFGWEVFGNSDTVVTKVLRFKPSAHPCFGYDTMSITVKARPIANVGSMSTTICAKDTIQLGGPPLPNHIYNWSPSTWITGFPNIANPLLIGFNPSQADSIYKLTLQVTDTVTTCSNSDTVQVIVKPLPIVSVGPNPTSVCRNDSVQIGTLPEPDRQYLWFPPVGISNTNVSNPFYKDYGNPNFFDLKVLRVTNSLTGCIAFDSVAIFVLNLPFVNAGADITICSGDTAKFSTGSTTANSFLWSPGIGLSSTTIQDPFVTHINPTQTVQSYTYYLLGTDVLGCKYTDTVAVFVEPLPIANAGTDQEICSKDTIQLGAVSQPNRTYLWTPATGLSSTALSNPNFALTNTTQTNQTYTFILQVTNTLNGCINYDTVTITVKPLPITEAGPDQEVCSMDTIQLGVAPQPNRAYLWTPSIGLSSSTVANPFFSLTNPTQTNQSYIFVLRVTNTQNTCINYDTVTITVKPLPITEAGPDQEVCSKDTIQLGVVSQPDRAYLWTPATGLSSTTISNPFFTLTNTTQTNQTYTFILRVTNTQNGCINFDTVTVTVKPLPITEAGPDQELCSKDTIQLGVASVPNRQYQWTPGLGLSDPTVSNPLFTLLNPTQLDSFLVFVLQVANTQNVCTDFDTVRIRIKPLPIPDAGPDKEVCSGDTVLIGTSAEPVRSYLWSPPTGVVGPTLANPGFTRFNSNPYDTIYSLVLRVTNDTNGCVDFDTVLVNVNGRAQSGITGSVSICPNELGLIYWVPSQDSATYLWSISGGTIVTNPPVGDTISVNWGPTNPNALVQVIPFNRNNCPGDTVILPVVINLQLDTETPNGDTTLCSVDRFTTYHVFNVPTRAYNWFISGGTILSGQGSSQITVEWTTDRDSITHGTLYVLESSTTPTDTCFGYSDTILVTLYPSPDSTLNVDGIDELCAFSEDVPYSLLSNLLGSSFNWSIIPPTTGLITVGQGSDSILIDWGGTPVNQTVNTTVRVVETSVYGCIGEPIDFDVLINPLPVVETGPDTATCSGVTIQIGNVPVSNYAYSWNTSSGLSDSTFADPLLTLFNYTVLPFTSTYFLQVTNTLTTCTDWDSLQITIYPEPDSTLPIVGLSSICASTQVPYVINSLLSGSMFSWSISPPSAGTVMGGQGTNLFTVEWVDFAPLVLTFANLSVLETSVFGCARAVIDTTISIYPVPKTQLLASDTIVCPEIIIGNQYQVSGLPNSTYQWFANQGVVVSGNSTDSVVVNWLPFNASNPIGLRVVETSDFGCIGDTLSYNLIFDATGLEILVVSTEEENHRDTRLEFTINRNSFYQESIRVYRFADGEGESLIKVYPQTANLHEDTELNTPTKVYYYVLKGINRCGIEIESEVHNTILLLGYPVESRSESVLFWNGYNSWQNGVNRYEIWRKIDGEIGFTRYETTIDTFVVLPNGQDAFMHQYRILAVNGDGSYASWSNILQLNFENKIWMANTITANGDGLNDVLMIENVHLYPVNKLSIYNRYGKLVYEQSDYKNDWSGDGLSAGAYYVFFQTFSPNAEYKGWVQIMR